MPCFFISGASRSISPGPLRLGSYPSMPLLDHLAHRGVKLFVEIPFLPTVEHMPAVLAACNMELVRGIRCSGRSRQMAIQQHGSAHGGQSSEKITTGRIVQKHCCKAGLLPPSPGSYLVGVRRQNQILLINAGNPRRFRRQTPAAVMVLPHTTHFQAQEFGLFGESPGYGQDCGGCGSQSIPHAKTLPNRPASRHNSHNSEENSPQRESFASYVPVL